MLFLILVLTTYAACIWLTRYYEIVVFRDIVDIFLVGLILVGPVISIIMLKWLSGMDPFQLPFWDTAGIDRSALVVLSGLLGIACSLLAIRTIDSSQNPLVGMIRLYVKIPPVYCVYFI